MVAMIRRQRGRRDPSEATSARIMTRARRSGCWVLALCALVALGGACKKKGPSPNENVGEQGIGEENLGFYCGVTTGIEDLNSADFDNR